jgi:hypothetical protein
MSLLPDTVLLGTESWAIQGGGRALCHRGEEMVRLGTAGVG